MTEQKDERIETAEAETAPQPEKKPKKKKSPGRFRRSMGFCFKPMINAKAWLAYDEVKRGFNTVGDTVNELLTVAEPEHEESFDEAKQRLDLSDGKLKEQGQAFKRMSMIFLIFAGILLVIAFVFLATQGIYGFLICLLLSLIGLANAFRYHFWYFQVKQKKLGCTVNEWLLATFSKRGKSH